MKTNTKLMKQWSDIHGYAKQGWIFRGQRDADWEMATTLERTCARHRLRPHDFHEIEKRISREFRRAYHHYGDQPPAEAAVIEWMSLMQHHGAPTRLLDFTYSMYVAAYFAVESADSACAVWAIDAKWVLDRSIEILRQAGRDPKRLDNLRARWETPDQEKMAAELWFEEPRVLAAWPVNPFRLNQRLRTQQGIFLAPGDLSRPFTENLAGLGSGMEGAVLKIVIPEELAMAGLKSLSSMALSRTTLFPGLDGFPGVSEFTTPASTIL